MGGVIICISVHPLYRTAANKRVKWGRAHLWRVLVQGGQGAAASSLQQLPARIVLQLRIRLPRAHSYAQARLKPCAMVLHKL